MRNLSTCPPLQDPNTLAKDLMQRAHNRDGLPEIAVGLTFVIVGALSYAQVLLPAESIGFKAVGLSLALLIPVLCLGTPRALRWVRRRYLIERVGYVESRPMGARQIGIGITLAVLAAVVLWGVAPRLSQPDRWILAGTGVLGGVLAAFSGRLPRFVIGGVLVAATGVALAFSGLSLQAAFAILFGFQGLLALISGVVVFLRLLRHLVEPGGLG